MTKNKYNISSWRSTLVWSVITMLICVIWVMAVQKKSNTDLSSVNIVVKSYQGKQAMISKKDVRQKLHTYLGYDIRRAKIKDLDIRAIEAMMNSDERIRRCEVYLDNENTLNVFIAQKDPILRVIDRDQHTYYLDEGGEMIPGNSGPVIRVPVATGDIEPYDKKLLAANANSKLKQIYDIAKYVYEDEFLTALVEQIDINSKGDITMVPKIGRQKLSMGQAQQLDEKFDRLKTLYKNGLPKIGWRKHSVFRLDLEGQITGVKRQ